MKRRPSPRAKKLCVKSVNWHIWPFCNYRCQFCFAPFRALRKKSGFLNLDDGTKLIDALVGEGMRKLTFAGGEPMLCPWLGDYLEYAKDRTMMTMIVTNGSRLTKDFLQKRAWAIDWVALSIDSAREDVERNLGRGTGDHVSNVLKLRSLLRDFNIKVKVNVTVTRWAIQEDLHSILSKLEPDRIKFLQVLPIRGENDQHVDRLLISRAEFYRFVERHRDLGVVAEDNDSMRGSYVMIDPVGRFFQNTTGALKFSDPILEVGVQNALNQVGFDWDRLVTRGGDYYFTDSYLESTNHSLQGIADTDSASGR